MFATVLTVELRINTCFDPPTRGLFLTCTEEISDTHTHYMLECLNEYVLFRLENSLLGIAALCTWLRIAILAGPVLRVNCLIPEPPALHPPPFPFFLPIQTYCALRPPGLYTFIPGAAK